MNTNFWAALDEVTTAVPNVGFDYSDEYEDQDPILWVTRKETIPGDTTNTILDAVNVMHDVFERHGINSYGWDQVDMGWYESDYVDDDGNPMVGFSLNNLTDDAT